MMVVAVSMLFVFVLMLLLLSSRIPLSAMNMSISNPSMRSEGDVVIVALSRASKGQKETNATVAKRTVAVSVPVPLSLVRLVSSGGDIVDEGTRPSLSSLVAETRFGNEPAPAPLLLSSLSSSFSSVSSPCFAL